MNTFSDDKKECIRNLTCTRNAYYLSFFGLVHLWHLIEQDNPELVQNIGAQKEFIGRLTSFDLITMITNLKSYESEKKTTWREDLQTATSDAITASVRTYLKESFQWTKDYAYSSNQQDKLHSAAWFRFARLARNTSSHSWIIQFESQDKKLLNRLGPISYEGSNITIDDDGNNMKEAGITTARITKSCDDMYEFTKNELD